MADGALAGRVALITGGSRGIGAAIAHAYADEGADVAIVGRDRKALEETAEGVVSRGRRAHVAVNDLRDISVLPEVFDQAEGELGEISILVANAGVQDVSPALEVTEAAFDEQSDINLKSLFFTNQEAGRRMIERGNGGNIVNLGSTFSVVGFENFSVYCATKAGVQRRLKFAIHTPLIRWTKAQIIHRGTQLGVDYGLTRSCYDPAPSGLSCGRCDACRLRLEGFAEAGLEDPLKYQ